MHGKKLKLLAFAAILAFLAPPAWAEDGPVLLVPETAPQDVPQPDVVAPKAKDEKALPVEIPVAKPAARPVDTVRAVVNVRAAEHEQFDRVVFDWPRDVAYTVTRDGGRAALHFKSPADVRLGAASHLTRARGFAASTDAAGNLTVSFAIDPHATLKDFTSGHSVAVDIQGSAAQANVVPVVSPAASPSPPPVEKKPEVAQVPEPPKPTPPVAVPVSSPSIAQPEVPKEIAVTTKPAESAPAVSKITVPVVAAPAPTPPAAAPSPAAVTAAPVQTKPTVGSNAGTKDPLPNLGATPLQIAAFDPHTPSRATIWARGGYGYIVFDRKFALSAEAITAGLPAPLVTLQALDLPKASGFRFALPTAADLHAARDGTVWKLFVMKQQSDVPVSSTLVAQPDFALGARFLLPLPAAPEPIRFTDPVVGDDLILIPLSETQAFSVARHMADFQIWPAAQGMVIKPWHDKLIVRASSDGIEITSDSGLHLSSSTDTGAAQQSTQKARAGVSGKSMFDFALWRGKPSETFTQTRQRLQQTIVDVPERERNRARLEFARFYFARGYGEEALGLLNMLAKDIPDLSSHADFLALLGASKIMAAHPEEGLKDLEASGITDQPEINLWQAVGNAEIRNWVVAEDKFAASEALLAGYPEPFYSRFYVLAIESALAVGNDREGADWLDHLETGEHAIAVNPAIAYLHGVLHAKSGRASAASDSWKEAQASTNHLYKIRAELALIDLGVANKSLTPAQAADRLEALRFGWRGDDLEVDILHRLGQFYIQAHNIKTGLSILAQAVNLYPKSPLTPKIHDEMSQVFHDVFLGELGKNLSPLESLTLYQQYRGTLMPQGSDGIAVIRNLAERLAAIDLMDQAGDLLEDIAKNRLKGEEKGRVAARLAAIRLLDHKPQGALDALDLSIGDFLPGNLQSERTLLRAKALSELHRDDEALGVLSDDSRFPAKLLRADISMHAQKWEEAAKVLLDLVGPAPRAGDTLRDDQADWLVRCALAYASMGDQVGLDKLAIDYGAAMAGTSLNNTFRILVQPEKSGQLRDIAAAQSRITDVDMFQSFLNTYRKPDGAAAADAKKKP